MKTSIPTHAKKCCSREKQRLMAALDQCEFIEQTASGKNRCHRQAAKKSGMRARSCVIAYQQ